MRIAIQGERGAFSDQAALALFPRATIEPCSTFAEVFDALRRKKVDRALVPFENTLAGSVGENYDLLLGSGAVILAETTLRIEHNLIVLPGVRLKDVRRVLSHPVALQQCLGLLRKHHEWEAVSFYDTAGSVKHLVEAGLRDSAAIASRRAAEIYGGKIALASIEDNKQNFTRFFLLALAGPRLMDANKVSVVFKTRNQPGALFKCLAVFALRDISLTRIESRPVPGQPWEYSFYVDFKGNPADTATRNALAHLSEITDFMRVLGAYRAAETKSSRTHPSYRRKS